MTADDIRDKPALKSADVTDLNFIRADGAFVFRAHPRQGLRSHIMEVLRPEDIRAEREGILRNGITWYPRARPIRMLRLFRTRFGSRREALEEIRRLRIIETFLPEVNIARSEEFLVDYRLSGIHELLLCGLQEYVRGEILDPWSLPSEAYVADLVGGSPDRSTGTARESVRRRLYREAAVFVEAVKRMIADSGMLPDLAGIGNLLLSDDGRIRLVDINNILHFFTGPQIPLDDKGYPTCDKSIEALFLLEHHLVDPTVRRNQPPYRTFLDPERMRSVRRLEEAFYARLADGSTSRGMDA